MDLQMLKEADQAIVVVGDEGTRSKTMDDALAVAIQRDTLNFRQVLLSSSVPPRLNPSILPVVKINDADFIGGILDRRGGQFSRLLIHFPRNPEAAKLLATSRNRVADRHYRPGRVQHLARLGLSGHGPPTQA